MTDRTPGQHLAELASQIPPRRGVTYPAATDPAWLDAAAKSPLTVKELAGIVGCSTYHLNVEISTRRRDLGRGRTRHHSTANKRLADRAWLTQQLENGADYDQIAAAANASPATVRNWIRRHHLQPLAREQISKRRRKYPALDNAEWLREQAASHTSDQIADQIGCQPSTVSHALRKAQISPYTNNRRITQALSPHVLRQMRADGLTLQQIGDRVDCDPSTVSKALKRHGLR